MNQLFDYIDSLSTSTILLWFFVIFVLAWIAEHSLEHKKGSNHENNT